MSDQAFLEEVARSVYADLVVCPGCDEWWCTVCELHWGECPCPGPHGDERAAAADPEGPAAASDL